MTALFFERTFEYKLRSFLWLLIPMSNNLTLLLFWQGSARQFDYITTYYILMTIGGLLTTSHVEYEVAEEDIKQGGLVNYLTKPIPYFWVNFLGELPYRVLQAIYGSILIGVFVIGLHVKLHIVLNPLYIPFVIIIFALGYFISITYKLCISYLSFWFTDMRGFYELMTILSIIFSGAVMPLEWYPTGMRTVAQFLPFAYSGYYPIATLMKPMAIEGILTIIALQGAWLAGLLVLHNVLWREGLKQFTAVGQ